MNPRALLALLLFALTAVLLSTLPPPAAAQPRSTPTTTPRRPLPSVTPSLRAPGGSPATLDLVLSETQVTDVLTALANELGMDVGQLSVDLRDGGMLIRVVFLEGVEELEAYLTLTLLTAGVLDARVEWASVISGGTPDTLTADPAGDPDLTLLVEEIVLMVLYSQLGLPFDADATITALRITETTLYLSVSVDGGVPIAGTRAPDGRATATTTPTHRPAGTPRSPRSP